MQNITTELATIADRLRRVTVRVRSGNLGIGAGTIWHADGLIITNAHVAISQQSIVELADGRSVPAVRTHVDPQQDLAVLKINAPDLIAAELGEIDRLRVGEMLVAVGNPLADMGAVTVGTLYAQQQGAIVADIKLYPGNSGGPLADCLGRVVGINTAIVDGLAVAISIAKVTEFLQRCGSHPAGVWR